MASRKHSDSFVSVGYSGIHDSTPEGGNSKGESRKNSDNFIGQELGNKTNSTKDITTKNQQATYQSPKTENKEMAGSHKPVDLALDHSSEPQLDVIQQERVSRTPSQNAHEQGQSSVSTQNQAQVEDGRVVEKSEIQATENTENKWWSASIKADKPKLFKSDGCFKPLYKVVSEKLSGTQRGEISIGTPKLESETSKLLMNKQYYSYPISLKEKEGQSNVGLSVVRRFSQFMALASRLLDSNLGHLLPVLSGMDSTDTETRRWMLESYLNKLLSHKEFKHSLNKAGGKGDLHSFLYNTQVRSASLVRVTVRQHDVNNICYQELIY